jgi:murein DD-endopeptidase MepM/ murein hydrolase activator NlpD
MKRKLANINQEAKIGVSIILVALLFFGGVGLTKKWWQPETSISSTSSSVESVSSSSSSSTIINSEPVANELDEVIAYPYPSNATIQTYFFDVNDDLETQTKSIVYYEGKYYSSRGIDVTLNNEEFMVSASSSGKVIKKTNDPTYGLTILIESPNNIIFSYSSLASSPLKEGDKVKKGALIGYAGECDFGKELKSKHLHFEVYYNKTPINPLNVFNKEIGDIK